MTFTDSCWVENRVDVGEIIPYIYSILRYFGSVNSAGWVLGTTQISDLRNVVTDCGRFRIHQCPKERL
jgi:hypothetical protein